MYRTSLVVLRSTNNEKDICDSSFIIDIVIHILKQIRWFAAGFAAGRPLYQMLWTNKVRKFRQGNQGSNKNGSGGNNMEVIGI